MKRIIAFFSALVIFLLPLFAACSGKPDPAQTDPAGSGTAAAAETQPIPEKTVLPDFPEGRYDAGVSPRSERNETTPLSVAVSGMDGRFHPLFYPSAAGEAVRLTQLPLLDCDASGRMTASADAASAAWSVEQTVDPETGRTVYTFFLKNGLTFSDGSHLLADDLIFTIYLLCDPLYDGPYRLSEVDIVGLVDYRTQTTEEVRLACAELAKKIRAAGINDDGTYPRIEGVPAEQQRAYWSYLPQAGARFAQKIIDVCWEKYAGAVGTVNFPNFTEEEVAESETLRTVLGMKMWGFGDFVCDYGEAEDGRYGFVADPEGKYALGEDGRVRSWTEEEGRLLPASGLSRVTLSEQDGALVYTLRETVAEYTGARYAAGEYKKIFLDAAGALHDLSDPALRLDADTYFSLILSCYGYNFSDRDGINSESAGLDLFEALDSLYTLGEGSKQLSGGVAAISGVSRGKKVCEDGAERAFVSVETESYDPTDLQKFGFPVVPELYYASAYEGERGENGVVFNDRAFMDSVKSLKDQPVGAGPYRLTGYEAGVASYEANDAYCLGSPKIRLLLCKTVASGGEVNALRTGEVALAAPASSPALSRNVVSGVSGYEDLAALYYDVNAYGSVSIQARAVPELAVRRALIHTFNAALAYDNYYGELAGPVVYVMSKALWAYPDDRTEPFYPYDPTGETSLALFREAGCVYDENANVMKYPEGHEKAGQQVELTYTLPYPVGDHPLGEIFADSAAILARIGVKVTVEIDPDLSDRVAAAYESGLQVYASVSAANGADPDLFPRWYSDPSANQNAQAGNSGIFWLYKNGDAETVSLLTELNERILAARSDPDPDRQKAAYAEALSLAASLAVEAPIYQRRSFYVYNKKILDPGSLPAEEEISVFRSPLRGIHLFSFAAPAEEGKTPAANAETAS
ncbi:MAG: hypothetical protein IJR89_05355 [Clostridia bacterium]|nr:hypothetical protein [Clostridia bacterium]